MDQELKDFIKSDLDESEFYEIPRGDSMTLGEYLEKMKELDFQFQQMSQFEIFSIKRKCNWVDEVWFCGSESIITKRYSFKGINLYANDGREIYSHLLEKNGEYGVDLNGIPKIFLLNKGVRTDLKRLQDFYKIQDELKEIESIGSEVYKGNLPGTKFSLSSDFHCKYTPGWGLYLGYLYDDVASYMNPDRKDFHKPILKDNKDKSKLLRKVLIPND